MATTRGYNAARLGISHLPLAVGIVTTAGLASRQMAKIGARRLILTATTGAGGMFWFSHLARRDVVPELCRSA